jgi:hypothetical protein
MVNSLIYGLIVGGGISIVIVMFFGVWWASIVLIVACFLVCAGIALAWRPIAVRYIDDLAKQNKGFTYVDEGTVKFAMLGGEPIGGLMQFDGYNLDNDYNVIPNGGQPSTQRRSVFFGAHRFENPFVNAKKIFMYEWRRSVVDEFGHHRELRDEIDFVPLTRDVYWCQVEGAEDENLMDVELLLTVQVVNPHKALFRAGATPGVWLQLIMAISAAEARNAITQKPYGEWIVDPKAMGDEIKRLLQEGDTDVLEEEFKKVYGVNLLDISVLKVSPAGQYQALVTTVREAELKADAERALASGQADAFKQKVEAMRALGNDGRFWQMMDALSKGGGGAQMMVMIPDLMEEMRKVRNTRDEGED